MTIRKEARREADKHVTLSFYNLRLLRRLSRNVKNVNVE